MMLFCSKLSIWLFFTLYIYFQRLSILLRMTLNTFFKCFVLICWNVFMVVAFKSLSNNSNISVISIFIISFFIQFETLLVIHMKNGFQLTSGYFLYYYEAEDFVKCFCFTSLFCHCSNCGDRSPTSQ